MAWAGAERAGATVDGTCLGDTSNSRLGEVILTTCLEEAFQRLLWRKRQAEGGPKTMGSSHLARVKLVP